MNKRLIGRRLLAVASAACIVAGSFGAGAVKAQAAGNAAQTAKAWINHTLIGQVTLETPARLEDDFAFAVNKDWIVSAPVKAGRSQASTLHEVSDEMSSRVKSIIHSNASDHETQLVQKYYGLVTDWDTRNKLGVTPIQPYVNVLANMQSLDELTAYISDPEKNVSGDTFCSMEPSLKLADPTHYEIVIYSPALTRGDSADYPKGSDYGLALEYATDQISLYMMSRLGFTKEQAEKVVANAHKTEALMAPSIPTAEEQNAFDFIEKIQHPMTKDQLRAAQGSYPLVEILDGMGLGDSEVYNLYEPKWLAKMGEIYTPQNFDMLRDYVLYNTVSCYVGSLDWEAYVTAAKISSAVSGATSLPDDETLAVSSVNARLGGVVENLFIRKYCTPERRTKIVNLVKEVAAEYRKMLSQETWLSDSTRAAAIGKIDALTIRACYPDRLDGFGHLDFKGPKEGGNLVQAARVISEYDRRLIMKKVNGAKDANEWAMSTVATNAYYSAQDNSVNILEGILYGAAYNDQMSEEERMAAIGIVIGHEISHAFDTSGALFDASGHMTNWWTAADRAAFDQKAKKLIAYYDAMEIPGARGSYGQQVAGEAIADMGGMRCMLNIAATRENFDYDKFFRSFAAVWCNKQTSQTAIQMAAIDEHPLQALRINCTVQQFQEFYDTYDVKPGDGMYLAPEERVAIW